MGSGTNDSKYSSFPIVILALLSYFVLVVGLVVLAYVFMAKDRIENKYTKMKDVTYEKITQK